MAYIHTQTQMHMHVSVINLINNQEIISYNYNGISLYPGTMPKSKKLTMLSVGKDVEQLELELNGSKNGYNHFRKV